MLYETVRLALQAIFRNALRSFLTVLGVVIGVGAVIAMVTIGNGTTAQVQSEIASLGTNLLFVRPGQGFGPRQTNAPEFRLADAEAISNQIAGLRAVAPSAGASAKAVYGNANWSTSITGTNGDFLRARDWPLVAGRNFLDSEERAGSAVCIIGQTVKRELFGAGDPIGENIRLNSISCEVIGLLEEKGQGSFGQDQDDTVLMPIRTVQRRFAGDDDVASIFLSAEDGVDTAKIKRDVTYLMRERRGISADEDDNFSVNDMAEMVSTMTTTTRVLTGLLAAVAAVSLLVGGIGIMNIMLVSVTERTREIGIRLAIGAEEGQVLMQFLVEAVVLSLLGGLIGVALGLGLSGIASFALGVPFVLDPQIVALAFVFSAAVGVGFGYFPARRAARLDPIEALRHE
jgi:putative ABC transport system permease protein